MVRDYIANNNGKFVCYKDRLTGIPQSEWNNKDKTMIAIWDKSKCEYRYYRRSNSEDEE